MKLVRLLLAGGLALPLSGCALFSRGDVEVRRYFSPDLPARSSKVGAKRSGVELRLGRVSAGTYIGEKIVYRESNYELGFYDDRFWTEKPEAYVRRALKRVLFEEEGLRSVINGSAPTLDVELDSFEEVKAPVHLALVQIAFSLHDDRVVLMQQTMSVSRPIAVSSKAAEPYAVAEALGEALRDAVYAVSGRVLRDIANVTAPLPPCRDSNATASEARPAP